MYKRQELKKTDNLSDVMAQLATDYNIMEMNSDSAQDVYKRQDY